ncbi:hypothetical protein K1T71_002018 [Dendrolimus kikuchii]|uniref:Uncharacterized protein n=1 Tax=Dendrolimus kikuchii TaxID=765133 RepID=A0ACC1DFW3_9NEOP|nr:hypothetical protein K1T71_002018 [Dendrolimus kikuchii]
MSENKTILLVLFLFVLAYDVCTADDRPEATFRVDVYRNVYQAIYKCMSETGVHPEVIQLIRDGTYEEDAVFKKFLYCAYVKSGYATEDGDIKIDDVAKEFSPEYNIITYLRNCISSDSDPVEKVFKYFKCYQDTSPSKYVFSHETTLKIRGAMSICLAETGADPNSIEVIRQGKYCFDEPFKKFIHCSFSKSGYLHSDGSFNICKAAAEFSDEERMKKVMEKCDLKIRHNPVETSFAFFKCFQDTSPVVLSV